MTGPKLVFNPPPGWPQPPKGWVPPKGWQPEPGWPAPPTGWKLWIPAEADGNQDALVEHPPTAGAKAPTRSPGTSNTDARVSLLEAELVELRKQLANIDSSDDTVVLDDERVLQAVGIYRYHHPLEDAAAYQERLNELGARISEVVKSGRAINTSNLFAYDNSIAKGRRMCRDLGRLMLRAYNAEVDVSLRTLRAGNVITAKKRVTRSREAIAKLGRMMEMSISEEFHNLRIEEIELTADFLVKKQEEREAAREERARLREEKRVAAELAAEREQLDKERAHIANAIAALKAKGESDRALEEQLQRIDGAIEQNDYRAANVRAGYVYVISNRGAFGSGVVKIGLTRRLEPEDRVSELSGAAVPFRFDVHCLFFSEDAVTLEWELHQHFTDRRLNQANARKEFFFATPAEVRDVLMSKVGNLLEFKEAAESTEYLQSVSSWPARQSLYPPPTK